MVNLPLPDVKEAAALRQFEYDSNQEQRMQARIDLIQRSFESPNIPPGKVVVAPAGTGYLLASLYELGYSVVGYEPRHSFKTVHQLLDISAYIEEYIPTDDVALLAIMDEFPRIERPEKLLMLVRPTIVVISLPLFDLDEPFELQTSPFFSPETVPWYFSERGISDWMSRYQYLLLESIVESDKVQTMAFVKGQSATP